MRGLIREDLTATRSMFSGEPQPANPAGPLAPQLPSTGLRRTGGGGSTGGTGHEQRRAGFPGTPPTPAQLQNDVPARGPAASTLGFRALSCYVRRPAAPLEGRAWSRCGARARTPTLR